MYQRKSIDCTRLCIYEQPYPLIVTAFDGELQNVVRDFKKYTSKKLIEAIKEHPESRRETQRSGSAMPMAITEI